MTLSSEHDYTYAEYLEQERGGKGKHEFLGGQIRALPADTAEATAIAAAVLASLRAQIEDKPFQVFAADTRVRVLATGFVTYPLVSVVRAPVQRDPADAHTILNPIVVVEVRFDAAGSPSCAKRLEELQAVSTLQEIVVASQKARHLELRRREGDLWTTTRARAGETLALSSIECELVVDEVYRDILDS